MTARILASLSKKAFLHVFERRIVSPACRGGVGEIVVGLADTRVSVRKDAGDQTDQLGIIDRDEGRGGSAHVVKAHLLPELSPDGVANNVVKAIFAESASLS